MAAVTRVTWCPARHVARVTCVVLPRAEQQQRVEGELVQGEPGGHRGHLPRVARVPDREEVLPLVGDEAEVPAHRGMRVTLPRIVLQTKLYNHGEGPY